MAVGVAVRERQAGCAEAIDLRRAFQQHLDGRDPPGEGASDQSRQGMESSGRLIAQAGDRDRGGDRRARRQVEVQADPEPWRPAGVADRVLKRREVDEERGRGHGPGVVRFQDAAVDARGESEVVGIDDETALGFHEPASSITVAASSAGARFVNSGTTRPWRASPNSAPARESTAKWFWV